MREREMEMGKMLAQTLPQTPLLDLPPNDIEQELWEVAVEGQGVGLLEVWVGEQALRILETGVPPWVGAPWVHQAHLGPPVLLSQEERSSLCSGPILCWSRKENTVRLDM